MLHICYDKLLARHLSTDREKLREVLADANKYYRELRLHDPSRPDKPRDVVDVHGVLSKFQNTFYNRVLIRKLPVSIYSHGCIRGRSIKSNAQAHKGSAFVFKADISNFFPSITQQRVYRLFKDKLKCSPPVAKLCTRLCTYDHHLALGLVSSPILADQMMQPIDERIGSMCRKAGLQYTRFVDDVTISGPYDLAKSAVPKSLNSIFEDNGFALNLNKLEFGTQSESIAITGIRQNRRGNLDVKIEFFEEVERQLEDSRTLSRREQFNDSRPYYTRNQIFGRIQHIRWIHKQRGERLLSEFNKINWEVVEEEATQQRIMAVKKRLSKRPTPQNA